MPDGGVAKKRGRAVLKPSLGQIAVGGNPAVKYGGTASNPRYILRDALGLRQRSAQNKGAGYNKPKKQALESKNFTVGIFHDFSIIQPHNLFVNHVVNPPLADLLQGQPLLEIK